jgi:hypothetical protein
VDTLARHANQTAVTLKEHAPLPTFRHGLETPEFICNLSAAKEWPKDEAVALSEDLSDFLLN